MWNSVIRASIESYLFVCMGVLDNLKTKFLWDTTSNSINTTIVLLMVGYITILPIFFYKFLHKWKFMLSE